jgi:hypothetical protein
MEEDVAQCSNIPAAGAGELCLSPPVNTNVVSSRLDSPPSARSGALQADSATGARRLGGPREKSGPSWIRGILFTEWGWEPTHAESAPR